MSEAQNVLNWLTMRIRGNVERIEEALDQFNTNLPPGWKRDPELEARVQKAGIPISGGLCYSFEDNGARIVAAWLFRVETNLLKGGQVVPIGDPDMSVVHQQVGELLRRMVKSAVEAGLRIEPDSPSCSSGGLPPSAEQFLSAEALRKLEEFAQGIGDPAKQLRNEDKLRWSAFLIAAQRGRHAASPDDIEGWLRSRGFPPETARQLRGQYDFGFDLLEEYEQQRQLSWH